MSAAEPTKPLVGVLLGEAPTPEKAASTAETYRACPYCASFACSECMTVGVFALPPTHRWWLRRAATEPQRALGLQRVEVFFAQHIHARSDWSRGAILPVNRRAPCGAVCLECPKYHGDCKGCPATQYYLHD